jgi:uncharacterized protein (TIGR03067 family)
VRAVVVIPLLAALGAAAPVPKEKELAPADRITGAWGITAVVDGGENLFDPPGSGNQFMTFDAAKRTFREHLKSGRTVVEGTFKLEPGKGAVHHLDLPRSVLVEQPGNRARAFQTVTAAAVVRFDGKDGMTVCYFDPLGADGAKRPTEFRSTAENRAVLITLTRVPGAGP